MSELVVWRALLVFCCIAAGATFVAAFFVTAPYGRHSNASWGRRVDGTLGWVLMELPAAAALPVCLALAPRPPGASGLAFLALWELHYLHRAFVWPLRRRASARPMALAVLASGVAFNLLNGYLNGRWLFALGPSRGAAWLADPRFLVGAALFLAGLAVNVHADEVLLRLRRAGGGYAVPRGGLYRLVSCPNYLGEIVEWSGFALATWSPAAAAFALFTAANLVPRAVAHQRWYRARFADYPPSRRAVIPYLL